MKDPSKPCLFLGYGHEEFGYKLYEPTNIKLIRSTDLVFLKDQNLQDPESSGIPDFTPIFPVTTHSILT